MLRMPDSTALKQIMPAWILRAQNWSDLQPGRSCGIIAPLDRFGDLFYRAVERNDPALLVPVLQDWLEEGRSSQDNESLVPLLNKLLDLFFRTATEILEANQAIGLFGAALPVFAWANEFVARQELESDRLRVSQELEQTRRYLERLERSKSDFIAIAAHELKTPLTLIEGYAEMLAELQNGAPEQEQPKLMLKGIRTGTFRLREIIEDMIDVSLIDNQILSLNYQPLWLNRLFHILEEDFRDIIEERRLDLVIRPFPGSQEMTFGDPERLLQAFRNLLSNAIKYTPDGGKITIDGQKLPGFIEVTVADTGIGIDPLDHARVFEKFGRLGNTALHSSGKTKFKGGGPGLGLPITKGILEAHGGAIWVESEGYDEHQYPGATFHMLIPQRSEPPDEKFARLFRAALESGQLSPPVGYTGLAEQEL